jgi:hypothetical protein
MASLTALRSLGGGAADPLAADAKTIGALGEAALADALNVAFKYLTNVEVRPFACTCSARTAEDGLSPLMRL